MALVWAGGTGTQGGGEVHLLCQGSGRCRYRDRCLHPEWCMQGRPGWLDRVCGRAQAVAAGAVVVVAAPLARGEGVSGGWCRRVGDGGASARLSEVGGAGDGGGWVVVRGGLQRVAPLVHVVVGRCCCGGRAANERGCCAVAVL